MIKFFRKIRLTLHLEGKFWSYLSYAVGEIVLVVIGILIALKVNDWNEDVKNKKSESEFYCKLLSDFESDKKNIERLYEESEQKIRISKKLILDLQTKSKDKGYLINTYIKGFRTNTFIPNKATITDIMSTGKLSLLKNDSLKNNLIGYYAKLDNLLFLLEINRNRSLERVFLYDDNIKFGIQHADYAQKSLGDEILKILPENNWQNDSNSDYYKRFQNDLVFFVVMSEREKQHFDSVKAAIEPVYLQLKNVCQTVE